MKTIHIIIKGKVQGVGFRGKAEYYANKYAIKGTVRNLCNGTVEVYAQADSSRLKEFAYALKNSPGMGTVEHFIIEECEVQKKYESFEILF